MGSEDSARRAGDRRVIRSKVRVPTPRLDVVPRPRLLDPIDDDRRRVVLVSAPAGSGKTVLVLDWLHRGDRPVAWLSLDPLDNDPARFHAHLVAAFRESGDPAFVEAAAALETAGRSGPPAPADVVGALETVVGDAVVVLDDVHHLEAPPLRELLEALIREADIGPRLVLLTRVDPPIRLGRVRLSGALLELRQRDLRFTEDEATALFDRLLPGGLDPNLVARLEDRTEGWAAGLRMAAAALERVEDPESAVAAFTGSHEVVVDYLLEETLGRQDEAVRRFLMETSILPRFTAEACVAVTGDADAGDRLDAVDEANLFLVSLDQRGEWYRYHHLFAELLEYRLERLHPDRVDELRVRASRWFEAQGDVQEALRQAEAMVEDHRLLELLDHHGYPILARSEFASFARWLDRVPDPLDRPYPMFLAALAWYRFQTQRGVELEPLLEAIDRAIENAPPGYPERRLREARLHRAALRAFALRISERLEESVEAGEEALAALPEEATAIRGIVEFNLGAVHLRLANTERARVHLERCFDPTLQSGSFYLVLAGLAHLGYLASLMEGVPAARQRLESAMAFARDEGIDGLPAFAILLYQLAQVCFLADELAEARGLLERGIALTRDERETDILANVLLHLARVETAAGNLDVAEARLTRAAALMHGHNVKPFATSLEVERARLTEARTGRLQAPESAPPSAEGAVDWSSVREAEVVLQVEHLVKLGRRDEARALAGRLAAESETRRRGVALTAARIAEAATAETTAARHRALDAALGLAARHRYVRPVLQFGEPARALIEAALHAHVLPDEVRPFAKALLRRFPEPAPDPAAAGSPDAVGRGSETPAAGHTATPAPPIDHGLTEREIEALALLARGLTNKAMAKELFVSVNTVKTHLKRIYVKLDVSTRTEAAERARALGLIPPDQA